MREMTITPPETVDAVQGFGMVGGIRVVTQGANSITRVQGSYPECRIRVYASGTTGLSPIFDALGNPMPNPFTANTDGSWLFYAGNGIPIDVVMDGGVPIPMPETFTLTGIIPGGRVSVGPGGAAGTENEVQTNIGGFLGAAYTTFLGDDGNVPGTLTVNTLQAINIQLSEPGSASSSPFVSVQPNLGAGESTSLYVGQSDSPGNSVYFAFENGGSASTNQGHIGFFAGQYATFDQDGNWSFPGTLQLSNPSSASSAPFVSRQPNLSVGSSTSLYVGQSDTPGNSVYFAFFNGGSTSSNLGHIGFFAGQYATFDQGGNWTIPGSITVGTSVQATNLVVNNLSAGSSSPLVCVQPDLATGSSTSLYVGQSDTTGNSVYLAFFNGGSVSANRGHIGFFNGQYATFDQSGNWSFPGDVAAATANFAECNVDNSPVRTFANTPDGGGTGMVWPDIGIAVSEGDHWQSPSIDPATVPRTDETNQFTQVQQFTPSTVAGTTAPSNGLTLAWNISTGLGETDFINSSGAADGGFAWYDVAPGTFVDSSTPTKMLLNALGDLTIQGTLTAASKSFRIPHPLDATKNLAHGCIEGPEWAVFYRGEGQTDADAIATITLPDYFEALTRPEGRTVTLTELFEEDDMELGKLAASRVKDGKFRVRSEFASQRFYWEVKAVRADVEPLAVVTDKNESVEH